MSEPAPEQDTEQEQDYLTLSIITIEEFWDAVTGERAVAVHVEGRPGEETDVPLTTLLGNLTYAEHWLIADYTCGDDDEE